MLDFSNEALKGSERAFRRLWESYEYLNKITSEEISEKNINIDIDKRVLELGHECEIFMDDDFNTAKVIANLFDLSHIINGLKAGTLNLLKSTIDYLKCIFDNYLVEILGMKPLVINENKIEDVLSIIIDMRNHARKRKDFSTSDEIRDRLLKLGIQLKDGKDGTVTYSFN